MTDDNARYRSSDPFARAPDAGGPVNDPLAELARLIGQGDQFAEIGRDPSGEPPPREPQYYDDPQPEQQGEYQDNYPQDGYSQDAAGYEPRYADDPSQPYQPEAHYPAETDARYATEQPQHYTSEPELPYAPEPEPRYAAEPEPQYAPEPRYAAQPEPRYAQEPRYPSEAAPVYAPEPQRFAATSRYAASDRRDADRYDEVPRSERHRTPQDATFDPFAPPSSRSFEDSHSEPLRDAPPAPRVVQPDFLLAALNAKPAAQKRSYGRAEQNDEPPRFLSDRGPPPPSPASLPDDEYYDDAPQTGRRSGMMTVAAVFMLAVLGSGAAFGYRTWVNPLGAKRGAPQVIQASTEPTKVAPPPAADPNANKISYDRFADRGKDEKVVPREEKPVNLQAAIPAPAAVPAPAPKPSAAPQPAGNPPSVLTDPKRVRTVTIRPDGQDANSRTSIATAPSAIPPPPTQRQPAPQRQAAAVPAANAPLDLANPQQARASAPPPRPAPPPAAVRPAPPLTSANAPLSLAPGDAPLPPPGTRAPPTRVAAAPAASAAAPAANGRYLVQVSSQRSEADAQAAYRSLRSKYSNVLGDRAPVIRRADLAGKGTYYRAMVGPFSTRDQAVQLCSSLKAAGGDCVVQAN